jgi:hypothetical protein
MTRPSKLYRALWGLDRNPFPDHAIASAGKADYPFYENLHPRIASKMAHAFMGSDGVPPSVAFLWSLGEGEEARGYGKTTHLLWFTERINRDLGRSIAKLAGQELSDIKTSVAAYASFNSVEGLSLSNLLFDAVRDLVGAQQKILCGLRHATLEKGLKPSEIYESAKQFLEKGNESWSPSLLYRLCHGEPGSWAEYLDNGYEFSQWHKVRLGRQLLRSCVAFLRELGAQRLFVLVDQVEDFASFVTPTYKLRRDFPRLAYLCSADPVLRKHLTFVLTMHPRASRILSYYWPEGDLGPIAVDDSAGNVVRLGAMSRARFTDLVKTYIEAVRISGQTVGVSPLTEGVIDLVYELEHGRPGYCLQHLFFLLDFAAREGVPLIDREFAENFFANHTQRELET